MKEVIFLANSLARIKAFPSGARQDIGFQIDNIQRGETPDDWKPLRTVGRSAREIRVKEASCNYRVIYLARLKDAVYVLHAFQKKTQQTRKSDIDLACKRLKLAGDHDG